MPAGPAVLRLWMASFATAFTRPTWHPPLVLVAGTVLGPGRRAAPDVANFHCVLSRDRWSGRDLARRLLTDLVAPFVPEGPVIVGIDETIERRWGARISARGIYRDPVRSSKPHVVKASGLRWISVMVLVAIPWARRVWAWPVLSVLAPSER